MCLRLLIGPFVAVAGAVAAGGAGPAAAQQDNIYGLSAASVQNQATQVGTAFAENMQVLVFHLDQTGPAPGVEVTFTAPASGPSGTFATTGTNVVTVTSGENGIAMAPVFTANDQIGSFSVQVSAPLANPNFFSFTNAEDPASKAFSISVGNGSNQAAQINTTFAIAMTVSVFNGSGALLPGIDVVFAAPSSGPSGTFQGGGSQATVTTGSTGEAVAPSFTANGEVGTYSVTATVDGSQTTDGNPLTASFALRNSLNNPIGVPEIVSASAGNAQQTPVLTPFNENLQVVVLDGSLNHVQGATVVFTAPDTGPSGTFEGGATSFTTTSGATGLATAPTFTANAVAGSYGVTVSATKNGVTAQTNLGLTNGRVQTTTVLGVDPSGSSLQGQTVTLTATVTAAAGTLVPSADVEFTDGGTPIGSCAAAPSGGIASCVLNSPTVGSHVFQASYVGDAVSQPSESAEVAHEVIPAVPPTFSKSFSPVSILPGDVSRLTFTIDSSANTVEVPDLAFTDDLPAGVTLAATPDVSTDCSGGTVTADAGSGVISYTGGAVAAGASCTIAVNVTATDSGQHTNTSGELTSAAGSSGTATATLEVATVAKMFAVQAATGTGQISGAIVGGGPACGVDNATALDVTAVAAAGPDGTELPHGLIRLELTNCEPGGTVEVTLTLPTAPSQQAAYWKFGPTPTQPGSNDWYSITPTSIAGNQLTFTLVDGGPGDSDLDANGTIIDPGGPGQPETTEPPERTAPTTTSSPGQPGGTGPSGEPGGPGAPTSTTPGSADPDEPDAASTTTPDVAPGGATNGSNDDGSDGSSGNGDLPSTGTAAETITASAIVLVLAGAALLSASRRRCAP